MKTKKQSIGRRLSAMLLAILMLMSVMPVGMAALEPGSTVTTKGEWITGFYQDFRGSGLSGSFGTSWGQHEKFTANGQIAYCVQKGTEHHNGSQTVQETYASFSEEQQDLIDAALIYTYNGTPRYGQSDNVEYVASQAVIWAIQGGYLTAGSSTETTFLNCAFGGKTSSANRAACKEVYAKIKEQVLSHNTLPSFCRKLATAAPTHIMTYNATTKKFEAVLTDTKLKILQLPEILEKISAGFPLVQLDADAETSIQFITGLLFEGSGENNVGTKTTAANGNEYFKRTEKNHYPSGELLKKYYEAPGVNLWGQCPWYVRGRLYEMTGQRIPDGLRGNASQWYRANLNLGAGGYRSSSDPLQPKIGAVVCWGDKPSKITANGGNNYGHVAVIEEIYADGTMLISECNGGTANRYRDKYDKITHAFNTRVISMYSLDTSSQYFIGYIYSMD